MTTAESLERFGHFHDWYLDTVAVGPNHEPRALTLGLYVDDRRAIVTFDGATCVYLESWGLLNIVYAIQLLQPHDKDYTRARNALAKGERLSDRSGGQLAYMYSTLGAEMAVEFDSLRIEST